MAVMASQPGQPSGEGHELRDDQHDHRDEVAQLPPAHRPAVDLVGGRSERQRDGHVPECAGTGRSRVGGRIAAG